MRSDGHGRGHGLVPARAASRRPRPAVALLGVRLAPASAQGGAGMSEHAAALPLLRRLLLRARRRRGAARHARVAGRRARRQLLAWHDRFTRFDPHSELSRLNADPRGRVPVSRELALLAAAVADAGRRTGGLVDGTLVAELEAAGYRA